MYLINNSISFIQKTVEMDNLQNKKMNEEVTLAATHIPSLADGGAGAALAKRDLQIATVKLTQQHGRNFLHDRYLSIKEHPHLAVVQRAYEKHFGQIEEIRLKQAAAINNIISYLSAANLPIPLNIKTLFRSLNEKK